MTTPGSDWLQYGALGLLGMLVAAVSYAIIRAVPHLVNTLKEGAKAPETIGNKIAEQLERQDKRHFEERTKEREERQQILRTAEAAARAAQDALAELRQGMDQRVVEAMERAETQRKERVRRS